MKTFKVYPKEGKPFLIKINRFQVSGRGDEINLYNDMDQVSREGFLPFDHVAAIVPTQQDEKDMICFNVHLKNREPFPVFAHAFEKDATSVIFKFQQKDMFEAVIWEFRVKGIYIALSEVVAIIPSDGLVSP